MQKKHVSVGKFQQNTFFLYEMDKLTSVHLQNDGRRKDDLQQPLEVKLKLAWFFFVRFHPQTVLAKQSTKKIFSTRKVIHTFSITFKDHAILKWNSQFQITVVYDVTKHLSYFQEAAQITPRLLIDSQLGTLMGFYFL